jgi:hypothetical protein
MPDYPLFMALWGSNEPIDAAQLAFQPWSCLPGGSSIFTVVSAAES